MVFVVCFFKKSFFWGRCRWIIVLGGNGISECIRLFIFLDRVVKEGFFKMIFV